MVVSWVVAYGITFAIIEPIQVHLLEWECKVVCVAEWVTG